MQKTYLAFVEGTPQKKRDTLIHYLVHGDQSSQIEASHMFLEITDMAQSILSSMVAVNEFSNSHQLARNAIWNCEKMTDTDVEYHNGKVSCTIEIGYPKTSNLMIEADKEFRKFFRSLPKDVALAGSTTYDYDNHRASHGFLANGDAFKAWVATQEDFKKSLPSSKE